MLLAYIVISALILSLFLIGIDMALFRWPKTKHDIALAMEAVASHPPRPQEWGHVAATLSKHFLTENKPVQLTGRGYTRHSFYCVSLHCNLVCSPCRSGTEEDYTKLAQLLEDIGTYMSDLVDTKIK